MVWVEKTGGQGWQRGKSDRCGIWEVGEKRGLSADAGLDPRGAGYLGEAEKAWGEERERERVGVE